MDVLDEGPNLAQRCSLADLYSTKALLTDLISRQGFLKNRHERAVAREEHAIELVTLVDVFSRHVETNQRFARAGNPSHEADGFLRPYLSRRDDGGNDARRFAEIGRTCVAPRDLADGMSPVERQRRFYDGRRGFVAASLPLVDSYARCLHETQNSVDHRPQAVGIRQRHFKHAIQAALIANALAIPVCVCADQNRGDVCFVTAFVEVVQIQGVVNNLVHVLTGERILADLKFQHEDDGANDDESINSSTHAWNAELEIESARAMG